MTDAKPFGWPDASNPGVPANPEKDGAHWLRSRQHVNLDEVSIGYWRNRKWEFPLCDASRLAETDKYLGPCVTPSEVAAREAAAMAQAFEEAAQIAETLVSCSDEREGYMCHMNWRGIAAAIRALAHHLGDSE